VPVDPQAGAPSGVEQAVDALELGVVALAGELADEIGDRGWSDPEVACDLVR